MMLENVVKKFFKLNVKNEHYLIKLEIKSTFAQIVVELWWSRRLGIRSIPGTFIMFTIII